VHRLSVAKNDTKTNLQRSPETACRLINTVFAVFTLPYSGLQDSLHRATIFSDQARIPNICHGSNHFMSQLTSLVSCERARQLAGPRRPIANPILHRFCFQSTRSQTCVSTLLQLVARNWKIFCHHGRVDQGQRLNICERGQERLLRSVKALPSAHQYQQRDAIETSDKNRQQSKSAKSLAC